eukprot:TRINITY_DN369_c0_g1_i5.p1 TRINITY_DN369_c0_g1~~TRINITY_DN369_c0_g1_i5.p1  ORF type:complete len:566 (+),score=70.14 TRINITY_DN369_c0_g1_i5:120-1700(+)
MLPTITAESLFTKLTLIFIVIQAIQNYIEACDVGSLSCIFNGDEANIWRFTYAVSLQVPKIDNSNQFVHRSGATLIARNLILTAAHCVWLDQIGGDTDFREIDSYQGNISKPLYAAIAPDCRHEQGWERIRVVRFYFPPSYWGVKPTERGQDIAVLVLERGVREDMYPVIMNLDEIEIKENMDVLTIGWGAQYEYETIDQQEYASHLAPLKSADFEIIECEDEILSQMGREQDSLTDFKQSMLCAISAEVDKDQNICPGDSGGPLLSLHPSDPSKDVQIAVSMWAPNLACTGSSKKPSVFTKVSPWIESIKQIMKTEDGGQYKFVQLQDEVPYMVPDFEQIKMQAVFLPSNMLYQQENSQGVERAASLLQPSVPPLSSDTDADTKKEASNIQLHQYGFSNYSQNFDDVQYSEPQMESEHEEQSITPSLGVNPTPTPRQDSANEIVYESEQYWGNDNSTFDGSNEVDLSQVISQVQQSEEQKSQVGVYQSSDQFQIGLWLEQMGFLQTSETQEYDINYGYRTNVSTP